MKTLLTAVLFTLATAVSGVALADGHTTMRVVAVSTDNVDAYVAELKKGKAMIAKIAPKMRMQAWQATFAGDNAGLIVAEVELSDEAQEVPLPEWIGEEVTGDPRYFNANLVSRPYKSW